MSTVSARPALLQTFATEQSKSAGALDRQRVDQSAKFIDFVNVDYTGTCDESCVKLITEHAAGLVTELGRIALFVQVVHDAVVAADNTEVNGVVEVEGDLQPYLDAAAARYNMTFAEIAASDVITKDEIDLNDVSTVPNQSGFVNDPVCTATGHLLVDARDFVMPQRLDVLTFHRTYASVDLADNAFGPGWWSWTECRSEVAEDGSFVYHGPDALEFAVEPFGDGTFVGRPELDVQVRQTELDRFQLDWGRRSRYPSQRWVFAAGRLVEIDGPFVGTNRFSYGAAGLTRIEHDSGRSVTLRWRGRRVVAIESSDGRVARFDYDRKGRLVAVDNAVSPETYELDDEGRIVSITDADGVLAVAMVYDDSGRVVEQVTAAGVMTRFGYDSPRRTTLADRDHNPLSVYTHDAQGRVEMYATGGGLRFTRRFDPLGRVMSQRDPDGTSFARHESYDGLHRVEELRWSSGRVDSYTYDHRERLVEQSSPVRSLTFEYVGESPLPSVIRATGDEGNAIGLEWQHGTPSRLVDGDGVVNTFEIRPDGTIAAAANGYGTTTRYHVHAAGAVERVEYADGRVVHYERDDSGRLVAMIDAAGGRSALRYSPAGRLLSVTDAAGSVTTLEYDAAGTPIRIIAADGAAAELAFDEQQRPIGVRFANGDTIALSLDEFGLPLTTEIDGDRWVSERSADGRIVASTDPTGRRTHQTYGEQLQWSAIDDAAEETGRIELDLARRVTSLRTKAGSFAAEYTATGLVRSQVVDGETTRFAYTPGGRVATADTNGRATACRYDAAGHLVAVDYGRGWWTFDRDAYGQVTRRVSPAGREQRFEYDALGNVRSIAAGGAVWRFEYDPVGRITRTTDPTGMVRSFDYDAMGRLVESRDGLGLPVRYDYDVRGRIAAMIDAAGAAVRYEHNAIGKLTSIVDQLERRTVVTYDASGRHIGTQYAHADGGLVEPDPLAGLQAGDDTAVDFGDAVPLARSESADGATTRWTLPSGDTVELLRDADGLAERLTSPGFVRSFQRDGCGRIVRVDDSVDGSTSTTVLRRDLAGRVVHQDVDGAVTTYAYDDAGQLVRVERPDGWSAWQYDELGRLASECSASLERRFRYDEAHQLVELIEGDEVTRFEYDVRGRRVRARGRHDVVYVWGADRLEAIVRDGRFTRLTFDEAGRLRQFGDERVAWEDGEIAQPSALGERPVISVGASSFGSVRTDGAVDWRPFRISDAWGDAPDPSGARGGWHDYFGVAVDGVVWLGVRPYDIATRQFLSPDPLAPLPAAAGVSSPYTYAFNDPINFIDPTGRQGVPLSRSDFNDIANRYDGPQWGTIAAVTIAVVATVAVVVVTAGAAAPLALGTYAMIGAGTGLATGLAREGLEAATNTGNGRFDTGNVVKDTLVGFAGGFLGGVGGRAVAPLATRLTSTTGLSSRVTNGVATFVTEGAAGAGEATIGETYDIAVPASARSLLGGDGSFDAAQIPINAGINAVAGTAADAAVPHIPGLNHVANAPVSGAADPGTIIPTASPAPDLPTASPSAPTGPTATDTTTSGAADVSANGDTPTTATDTSTAHAESSPAPSDTSTSGGDSSAPAGDSSTSAGDSSAAAGDASATATDPSPAAGDSAPAADASASAGESSAGAGDTSTADSAASAGDASAPAGDTSAPAGDSSSSAADTPASAGDSATAGDSSPTAGDTTAAESSASASDSASAADSSASAGDASPTAGDSSSTAGDASTSATDTSTAAGDTSTAGDSSATAGDAASAGDSSPSAGDSSSTDGDAAASAGDSAAAGDTSTDTSTAAGDSSTAGDSSATAGDAASAGDSSPSAADSSSTDGDVSSSAGGDPPPSAQQPAAFAGDSSPSAGDAPTAAGDASPSAADASTAAGDTAPSADDATTTGDAYSSATESPPAGDAAAPHSNGDSAPASADDAAAAAGGAAVAARTIDAPTSAADTGADADGPRAAARSPRPEGQSLPGNRFPGDNPPAQLNGNPLNSDGTPVDPGVVLVRIDGDIYAVGGAQGGDDWVRGLNETGQQTSRSSFRKPVVRDTWRSAPVNAEGRTICSNADCDVELEVAPFTPNPDFDPSQPASATNRRYVERPWDMGHLRSWHNRWFHPDTPRAAVIDSYNRGLTAECQPCNRGAGADNDDRHGVAATTTTAASSGQPLDAPSLS